MSSGTVLTRRTSGCRNASFPEECGLGETQSHFPISKSEQEPGEDRGVPGASSLQADLSYLLQSFVMYPVDMLEPLWEKGFGVREREGWISLLGGREKDGEKEGSPSKPASKGTRSLLSLKEMFSPSTTNC